MTSPTRPPDESERLAALRRYDILDTPPEEGFDRVTRLAARALDVPIALIALLDENRQWYKSCFGLDRTTETDREISFCAHNVQDREIMVVEDATQDPRFANNPLVTGAPGVRFYAGTPLLTPDGHMIGSLCVIDTTPRRTDTVDLDTLRDLAGVVQTELELRTANWTLQTRNEQVQALSRDLKAGQETARSQLSELLHEELQQVLQAARMTLENVRTSDDLPREYVRRLGSVTDSLDDAVDVTRTLAARFAPPVGNQPLRDSLEWLAEKMRTDHGVSVSVLGTGAAPNADETLKTLLYRLVREVLFRIVRHADPDAVSVHLIQSKGNLRVTVENDAFDPTSTLNEEGRTLAQLRTQIESLGGSVRSRSCAGAGTCITIEVPPEHQHPFSGDTAARPSRTDLDASGDP
jgi:GAF domain-containing protein/predicted RNA-binding protein YlqC (UPF0109 family)